MRTKQCCPACGSDEIVTAKILRRREWLFGWTPHRWFCECYECGWKSMRRWTRWKAVRSWNIRCPEVEQKYNFITCKWEGEKDG